MKIVNGKYVEETTKDVQDKSASEAIWTDTINNYQELRVSKYPPIHEQLDMLYWDKVNGTNLWVDLITNIKTQHPKT